MADRVAHYLVDGEGDAYALDLVENEGATAGLLLWLPDLGVLPRLYPPRFTDAGPDDLLLVNLVDVDAWISRPWLASRAGGAGGP